MAKIDPVDHRPRGADQQWPWRWSPAEDSAVNLVSGMAAALAFAVVATAARAGEARCWIDRGALVAPAAFGDIAGDFLIDLSAPQSELHVTRAQSDGVVTDTVTRDLVAAGQRIPAVTLRVADLDSRTAAFVTSINGVLGADVLKDYVVDLDPSPCRLRLSRGPGRRLARSRRLPVREIGGIPVVPALISDGQRVRSGLFGLGAGDWASRLSGARLSRPPPSVIAADAPPIRLRALEFGGRLFEQTPTVVTGDPPSEVSGAIGMAVLSHWRMRLDMAGGWLDLAPAE